LPAPFSLLNRELGCATTITLDPDAAALPEFQALQASNVLRAGALAAQIRALSPRIRVLTGL
jgi:hypothetical protein